MTEAMARHLVTRAEALAPHEMCGLLFGESFYQAANVADDPLHAFEIAPEEYMKACMLYDGKPWAIVHSHPRVPAAPSVKDCRLMDALEKTNHDLMMVIVSLKPREIRAFKKHGHVYRCEWGHIPATRPCTIDDIRRVREILKDSGHKPL